MKSYPITDADGELLGYGCSPNGPPTEGDIAIVREFAESLRIRKEPVTNGENVRRGEGAHVRNSRKTHCVHGHPFEGDNLLISGGTRVCRACKRRRNTERGKIA